MLKVCRVTKVNVFFLVVVYVFNFELFEFSAAILEKGLLPQSARQSVHKKDAVLLRSGISCVYMYPAAGISKFVKPVVNILYFTQGQINELLFSGGYV